MSQVRLGKLVILLGVALAMGIGCANDASQPSGRSLPAHADSVLELLYERDWSALAERVHPERGVLFSPVAYVQRDDAIVFDRAAVRTIGRDDDVYVWGYEDGTGDPIERTPLDFVDDVLLDRDFRDAQRGGRDEVIGTGNTLNNVPDAFYETPPSTEAAQEIAFIEYHDAGTEAFGGMDWASLRLVFERFDGSWYLVGVVRDQWTI